MCRLTEAVARVLGMSSSNPSRGHQVRANAAWLSIAAMTHNLLRAAAPSPEPADKPHKRQRQETHARNRPPKREAQHSPHQTPVGGSRLRPVTERF